MPRDELLPVSPNLVPPEPYVHWTQLRTLYDEGILDTEVYIAFHENGSLLSETEAAFVTELMKIEAEGLMKLKGNAPRHNQARSDRPATGQYADPNWHFRHDSSYENLPDETKRKLNHMLDPKTPLPEGQTRPYHSLLFINGEVVVSFHKHLKGLEPLMSDKAASSSALGKGNCGTVYFGQIVRTGELVAIKVETQDLNENADDNYETVILGKTGRLPLGDLSTKRTTFDRDDPNQRAIKKYTIQKWFPGKTIEKFIPEVEDDLSALLAIAREMAKSTNELHEQKIIHRDVKPANFNILHSKIKPNRFLVYWLDPGVSLMTDDPDLRHRTLPDEEDQRLGRVWLSASDALVGSPVYVPPEGIPLVFEKDPNSSHEIKAKYDQAGLARRMAEDREGKGIPVSPAFDCYSLGASFAMDLFHQFFEVERKSNSELPEINPIYEKNGIKLNDVQKDQFEKLRRIILWCMQPDLNRRMDSAKKLSDKLDDVIKLYSHDNTIEEENREGADEDALHDSMLEVLLYFVQEAQVYLDRKSAPIPSPDQRSKTFTQFFDFQYEKASRYIDATKKEKRASLTELRVTSISDLLIEAQHLVNIIVNEKDHLPPNFHKQMVRFLFEVEATLKIGRNDQHAPFAFKKHFVPLLQEAVEKLKPLLDVPEMKKDPSHRHSPISTIKG